MEQGFLDHKRFYKWPRQLDSLAGNKSTWFIGYPTEEDVAAELCGHGYRGLLSPAQIFSTSALESCQGYKQPRLPPFS